MKTPVKLLTFRDKSNGVWVFFENVPVNRQTEDFGLLRPGLAWCVLLSGRPGGRWPALRNSFAGTSMECGFFEWLPKSWIWYEDKTHRKHTLRFLRSNENYLQTNSCGGVLCMKLVSNGVLLHTYDFVTKMNRSRCREVKQSLTGTCGGHVSQKNVLISGPSWPMVTSRVTSGGFVVESFQ